MRKRAADRGAGARTLLAIAALVAAPAGAWRAAAQNATTIVNTKHNLSEFGPGTYRALGETRICIFCHTPHNAEASAPLWNKALEPQTYQVYASATLVAGQKLGILPQPSGPTKLCLSCHDGTIALGAVLNPAGGIPMAGSSTLPSGSLSNFGLDLSGHHPVSFRYSDSLPNPGLAPSPPPSLVRGASDEIHCITCHDPHSDRYGTFLVADNRYSALCTKCHQISGWSASAHATSTASVGGMLPRPPNDWPTYQQLGEWGCEACHTPHFAPTAPQLLLFTSSTPPYSCTTSGCHDTSPVNPPHGRPGPLSGGIPAAEAGVAAIGAQVRKPSAHHELPGVATSAGAPSDRAGATGVRRVVCADCHNPHLTNARAARAPLASGMLDGVSGVDRNGHRVERATYEYEVCFKCHGDSSGDFATVTRVVPNTNTRLAFDPNNPSYHPVVEMGRSRNVPSIPSSLEPTMTASQVIRCTSCHADDEGGSRGPHGSSFAPILRERYDTIDPRPESYESYALCYRCHERTSILSDVSFRRKAIPKTATGGGHSGHLTMGATCATCHDPHGVNPRTASPSDPGDHSHLVNFDVRVVQPIPGSPYPFYKQTGTFSGTCTLVCHGVPHAGTSYP